MSVWTHVPLPLSCLYTGVLKLNSHRLLEYEFIILKYLKTFNLFFLLYFIFFNEYALCIITCRVYFLETSYKMCITTILYISVRYRVLCQKVNHSSLCGGDIVEYFKNVFVILSYFIHLFILIF